MRIEIDKELGKLLNQIKAKEPSIYGRGHADTVRFLANYYNQHKPIETLVRNTLATFETFLMDFDDKIAAAMRRSMFQSLGDAISKLAVTDENRTDKRSPAALQEPGEGR